jgi:glyoxylase-like metal-dependent hydrolase (beta-lactamase superfamily II)
MRTQPTKRSYCCAMKLLKRIGIAIGILVALCGIGLVYLLGSGPVPETTDYVLDVAQLRTLADGQSGERPIEIRMENIASAELPRALIMAGEDFTPVEMPRPVFQILYPDGSYVLIDTAYDRSLHEASRGGPFFDDAAWEKLVVAMEGASQIVVTHEHSDHLGGVARHPRPERLIANLRLTTEQLASRGEIFADLPDLIREKSQPLDYQGATALAPGIAVLKAPGHTPGSQMVFVALQDGREFLFVGDVVWNMDAITELKYRPRLITDLFLGEDRDAVMAQIRALYTLHQKGGVSIVVSHDRRTFDSAGLEAPFVLAEVAH